MLRGSALTLIGVFANGAWLAEYSNIVVERLAKGVSDHCPKFLKFETFSHRKGLFKFYNVLADHEEFEQIIRNNWGSQKSQNQLRDVWKKCMRLKMPLKCLNT